MEILVSLIMVLTGCSLFDQERIWIATCGSSERSEYLFGFFIVLVKSIKLFSLAVFIFVISVQSENTSPQ